MWAVRVVVKLFLWVVRVVCTTAPFSMSCSMPLALTMNRHVLTGTTTLGCTGKTSLMVRQFLLHILFSVLKIVFGPRVREGKFWLVTEKQADTIVYILILVGWPSALRERDWQWSAKCIINLLIYHCFLTSGVTPAGHLKEYSLKVFHIFIHTRQLLLLTLQWIDHFFISVFPLQFRPCYSAVDIDIKNVNWYLIFDWHLTF